MEPQKTMNSQGNPEKKEQSQKFAFPDFKLNYKVAEKQIHGLMERN